MQSFLPPAASLLVLAGLIGMLLPPLIAVVQQERWPSSVRAGVTVVLCAVVALATVDQQGLWHGWTWPSLQAWATAFFATLLATYGTLSHFWRQLAGGRLLAWVDHSTSVATVLVALRAWWKTHHVEATAVIASKYSPELLARAEQLLEDEKVAAAITPNPAVSPEPVSAP